MKNCYVQGEFDNWSFMKQKEAQKWRGTSITRVSVFNRFPPFALNSNSSDQILLFVAVCFSIYATVKNETLCFNHTLVYDKKIKILNIFDNFARVILFNILRKLEGTWYYLHCQVVSFRIVCIKYILHLLIEGSFDIVADICRKCQQCHHAKNLL